MSTVQFKYKELWWAFGVVGKILPRDINIPCKIMTYVVSTLQSNEFTLGLTAHATLVCMMTWNLFSNGWKTPS
jgi:hypothetical protein